MDWRGTIEQQKPATQQMTLVRTPAGRTPLTAAEALRRAGRDPESLERAARAGAYAERLRRDGHTL